MGCGRLGQVTFLRAQQIVGAAGSDRGMSLLAWGSRSRFPLWLALAGNKGSLCYPCNLKTERVIDCHLCTAENHNVSYNELKDFLESKTILLIDVREKWEIKEYGKIPGSISIPLGEVAEALQMDPAHFKERYSQDMPSKSDHLVFSCMAGVRSKQAVAAAKSLGFIRTQQYAGGFKEWAEYESSRKK